MSAHVDVPSALKQRLIDEANKEEYELNQKLIADSFTDVPYVTSLDVSEFEMKNSEDDLFDPKNVKSLRILRTGSVLGFLLQFAKESNIPLKFLRLWLIERRDDADSSVYRVSKYLCYTILHKYKIKDLLEEDNLIYVMDCSGCSSYGINFICFESSISDDEFESGFEDLLSKERALVTSVMDHTSGKRDYPLLLNYGVGKGIMPLRAIEEANREYFSKSLKNLASLITDFLDVNLWEPDNTERLVFFRIINNLGRRKNIDDAIPITYLGYDVVKSATKVKELYKEVEDLLERNSITLKELQWNSMDLFVSNTLVGNTAIPSDSEDVSDCAVLCGDIVYCQQSIHSRQSKWYGRKEDDEDGRWDTVRYDGKDYLETIANEILVSFLPRNELNDLPIVTRQQGLWKKVSFLKSEPDAGNIDQMDQSSPSDKDNFDIKEFSSRLVAFDGRSDLEAFYLFASSVLNVDQERLQIYVNEEVNFRKMVKTLLPRKGSYVFGKNGLQRFFYSILPFASIKDVNIKYFEIMLNDERLRGIRKQFLETFIYPQASEEYEQQVRNLSQKGNLSDSHILNLMQPVYTSITWPDNMLQIPDEFICDDRIYIQMPRDIRNAHELMTLIRNNIGNSYDSVGMDIDGLEDISSDFDKDKVKGKKKMLTKTDNGQMFNEISTY